LLKYWVQIAKRKNLVSSLTSKTPEQQKKSTSEAEISKDSTIEPPTEVSDKKGAYSTSFTAESLTPVVAQSKTLVSKTAPPTSLPIKEKKAPEEEKPVSKASKEEKPAAKAPRVEKLITKPAKEEALGTKSTKEEAIGTKAFKEEILGNATKTVEEQKIESPPRQHENVIGKVEESVVVTGSKDSEEEQDSGPLAGVNVMNVIVVAAECAPWVKTGV
jgi:hypothetical protein